MRRIAIIGSGPTAIYSVHALMQSRHPLHVTVYEKTGSAGTGMPYRHGTNNAALLANIASIELPPVLETLEKWLNSRSDAGLDTIGVSRDDVDERAFFPRVTLGSYFRDQLFRMVDMAKALGHRIDIKTHHEVSDVRLAGKCIVVDGKVEGSGQTEDAFDHVIVATGHTIDEVDNENRTYFDSPYPTSRLAGLDAARIGILGTSLSAIDAAVAIAIDHGEFVETEHGFAYEIKPGCEALHLKMMSRTGVLPEADFYCPIPYEPLPIFTEEALLAEIKRGSEGLLDRATELFKTQLQACDPDYAAEINLSALTADTFGETYFAKRKASDPFVWARANLQEVTANRTRQYTVSWRYAILRMHEAMEAVVVHFNDEDRLRFDGGFKKVFIDNYAAIPPQSMQRLLALHDASLLSIASLGSDYEVKSSEVGHELIMSGEKLAFHVLIDATGETAMSADSFPFPSLRAPLSAKRQMAKMGKANGWADDLDRQFPDTLTIDEVYMASLPYMLADRPFVQGLVSCHEVGTRIASTIIGKIAETEPVEAESQSSLMATLSKKELESAIEG